MERLAIKTIRQKIDLVTSIDGEIYILLRGTNESGVKRAYERYLENIKKELNLISPPVEHSINEIKSQEHLLELLGDER